MVRKRETATAVGPPTRAVLTGAAVEVILIALAVALPTLVGSNRIAADLVGCFAACLAAATLLLHRGGLVLSVPWYAGLLFGLVGYTLLQRLPLPSGLLGAIAPSTVEVLRISLGSVPAWHPISLDPSATTWEAMKLLSYAIAFTVAHNHLGRRNRARRLLLALLIGGTALALFGLVGALGGLGPQTLPGLPRPAGLISGSFFNPNHAAAFLTLCALAGVGVAITVTNKQRRVLAVLATVWVGAGVFLTLSRGGIFALGLGLGTLGLLLLRRTGARRSRAATAAAATAGLMIIFAALLAYERVLAEFFPNADGRIDLTKLALWPPAMRMIADNPWVGIGRGAFVSAFPRYLSEPLFARELTFSHVENQYLQLPAEWGLLVATVAIVGGLVALVGWLREQRETAICAAGAALIAIAAHNLVDFNLEMSAIALPVAILAGLLSSARRVKVKRRRGRVPALVLLSATVVAAALATVGAIAPHRSTADELTEAIAAIERGAPLSRARALIEPVIRRHPADYYPHLLLGRAAASQGSPAALAALDRALQLDPAGASVHAEAALTLQRFGRTGQALVELRLALQNHAPAAPLIARAVAMARGADDLALLLPELPELHAQAIGDLLRLGRTELAVRTARRAWRRWPGRAELLEPTTRALLAAGQTSDALETAKRWTEKQPRPRAFRLWAEAAARAGDRRRGIAILERGRRRFPADSSLALALGAALVADGSLARASALAERLTRELADPRQLAQAFALLARVHRAADRPHEAQAADQEARRLRALP